MLIIKNEKKNVKYKYIAFHHNELFINDTLRILGLNLLDMFIYTIDAPNDFIMYQYTGDTDILHVDSLPYIETTAIYSKMKPRNILTEYRDILKNIGFDMYISKNYLIGGKE